MGSKPQVLPMFVSIFRNGVLTVSYRLVKTKMQIFLHPESWMPWGSSGPSLLGLKGSLAEAPGAHSHNHAGLPGERGQRNHRLDRLRNKNKQENKFK